MFCPRNTVIRCCERGGRLRFFPASVKHKNDFARPNSPRATRAHLRAGTGMSGSVVYDAGYWDSDVCTALDHGVCFGAGFYDLRRLQSGARAFGQFGNAKKCNKTIKKISCIVLLVPVRAQIP